MNARLQDIYDGFAETYEQNRGLFDMSAVFDAFNARLGPAGGALLDLGCGAGEPFARGFVDRGWRVTGVDFSTRMLELAARYVPEMQTLHADMREVDFAAASFDAITAIYSLFHVPRADHPALFQRFHAWLRPAGNALFTYATRAYTGADEFDGDKEFMGQRLFYSHTTPAALRTLLEATGFVVEAMEPRDIGGEEFLWVTVSKAG